MVYTTFEKIITFTTILTIAILSLHILDYYNIGLVVILDDLSGLSGISDYPVVGLGLVGAILMLGGVFLALAFGGKIKKVSRDRNNMQSVIIAYGVLWGFIITLIIIG